MSLGLVCHFQNSPAITDEHRKEVERLLECLQRGEKPRDESPDDISDSALNRLSVKNFPELRRARAKLQVKAKDPKLDVIFRVRITAMAGTLNLYLDPEMSYTWHQASLVVSKSQGHGVSHARNIRTWIHRFLSLGKLPLHRYGRFQSCIRTSPKIFNSISSKSPKVAMFEPRMWLITLTDLKFKGDWVRRQKSR